MKNDLTTLVLLGITAMFVLMISVLLAVFFTYRKRNQHRKVMQELKEQQQNQLIEAAVRSEENERHRIAETLHDEVGAILSSAKLHLLGIKAVSLDESDKKLHEKGAGLLNDVIQKVRSISHNLHSNILKEFGLNEAICHFLKQVTGGTIIKINTNLDENYHSASPENDISLYRMIQELVNNILKHADASSLAISSVTDNNQLLLSLFHNGKGLTQQTFEELSFRKEGLGLKNIKNRVLLLKGTIQFTKDSDGYRINIAIPINEKPVQHE